MEQQTPLQFFLTKLIDLEIGKSYYVKQHQEFQDAYKQARQMEYDNAFKIFKAGQDSMEDGGKSFEEYYNQTYNK